LNIADKKINNIPSRTGEIIKSGPSDEELGFGL
jgi:hypothetical protein